MTLRYGNPRKRTHGLMSSMEVSLRKYRQSKDDGEHIWKGRQKGSRADMLLSSLKSLKMSPLIRDNGPNSLAWKRRSFVVWAHLPDYQNPVLQLPPTPLQTYQPTLPTSELRHVSFTLGQAQLQLSFKKELDYLPLWSVPWILKAELTPTL